MAEVFGAAASGAGLLSLALQLGHTVLRLKSFYLRVQDMPKTLESLSFDLQTISLTLRELELHRQRDRHDSVLLDRCVSRCQEDVQIVVQLVDRLERRIGRLRLAGKIYAALKDPEINELMDDLERAKTSILLALQMYNMYAGSCHSWSLKH